MDDLVRSLIIYAVSLSPYAEMPVWEQRLGSDTFSERREAEKDLCKNGTFLQCKRLTKSRDMEVRLRSKYAYRMRKNEIIKTLEPLPAIDSMCYDCFQSKHLYTSDLWKGYGWKYYVRACPNPWDAMDPTIVYDLLPYKVLRDATRLMVVDWLDDGAPLWTIKIVLGEMHQRELLFLKRHNLTDPFNRKLRARRW